MGNQNRTSPAATSTQNRRCGRRAVDRVRPRRPDPADAGVLPPDRQGHPGLRRPLVLQRARAGRPRQLLRLRGRLLPRHDRRHGNDPLRARVHAEHHDPRPGPLRQLRPRRPHHRGAAADVRRRPRRRSTRSRSTATRSPPRAPRPSSRTSSTRRSSFETGTVGHTLVSGIEFGRETSDPIRRAYTGVPTTSLLASRSERPVRRHADDLLEGRNDRQHVRRVRCSTRSRSATSRSRRGFRWDRFDTDYEQTVGTRSAALRAWTRCRTGAPRSCTSPSPTARSTSTPGPRPIRPPRRSSLSVANVNLDPEENRTFEVGTKWDFARRPARAARSRSSARRS